MTGTPIRYGRRAGVADTEIEVEIFLTAPDDHEVYHLDQGGSAVWRLLATPHSLAEITLVFAQAFPEVPPARLAADLEAVLAELCARQLVVQSRQTG